MRVPYNAHRVRRTTKKTQPKPSAAVLPTPIDEENENFSFISIDDLSGDHSSSQQSKAFCDEEQQPSNTDAAASILEDFFFGSNATQKQILAALPSTKARNLHVHGPEHCCGGSPTSIILTPTCSCPHLERLSSSCSSLYSSNSLPASPKRPSLKPRSNSSDLSSSKRNVSFTDISVREYDVELSDHPSCSFGPPIQLGWDYQETQTTSVEDYEVTRSPHRRQVHELVLSYSTRRRRLKQSGYKKNDMKRAQQEADRIKRERLITELFLPAAAIDETIEKVFESVKGLFQRKREQAVVCQIHSPQLYQ